MGLLTVQSELAQHFIIYMHYIFFIHSPGNEHLDGFLILAIVNHAAMSIGVRVIFPNQYFQFCVFGVLFF